MLGVILPAEGLDGKNQAKRAFARAGLTSENAEMNWELPAGLVDMPWR
jgi:hypothetical protein